MVDPLIIVLVLVEPVPVDCFLVSIISIPGLALPLLMSVPLLICLLISGFVVILALVLSECPNRESKRRGQSTHQQKRAQETLVHKQITLL